MPKGDSLQLAMMWWLACWSALKRYVLNAKRGFGCIRSLRAVEIQIAPPSESEVTAEIWQQWPLTSLTLLTLLASGRSTCSRSAITTRTTSCSSRYSRKATSFTSTTTSTLKDVTTHSGTSAAQRLSLCGRRIGFTASDALPHAARVEFVA